MSEAWDALKWNLKTQIKVWQGKELNYKPEYKTPIRRFGSSYGGWWVCTELLNANSIVYDFGLGTDISFPLALIEQFGLHVWGFDPTPRSQNWLEIQKISPNFHYLPVGLSDTDSIVTLYAPQNQNHASFSVASANTEIPFDAQMNKLSTLMHQLNHHQIDILKMDIEGSEYKAIENILAESIPVRQLLVEIHHNIYPSYTMETSRKMIEALRSAGYKIFKISPSRNEYHFIKL